MKARMVLISSSVIMALMLLVNPIWAQTSSMVDRLAADQLPTIATTQLTVTQSLPLDQDRNSIRRASGGGGNSPYPLAWQRLTTNDIFDDRPVTVFNPKRNEYLVVWSECPGSELCNIVGRRTTSQGVPLGNPFTISSGNNDQFPAIGYNSYNGEYLVVYARYSLTTDLYGRIILGDGTLWGSELIIDDRLNYQMFPNIAFNPNAINNGHVGEYLVVYEAEEQIIARHVGSWGNVDTHDHVIATGGDSTAPDVAYNPARNEYLVTYAEIISNTPAIHNSDILAWRVDAAGTLLGSKIYVAVGAPDTIWPRVAVSANTYFIVHTSGPNDSNNAASISGAWITGNGTLIIYDLPYIAAPPPNGLGYPKVAQTSDGFLFIWQSVTGVGTANLYGRYFRSHAGLWSDIFTIDDAAYDQLNGDVACATGSCLIVDRDEWYENGHDYEITAWSIWLQKVFLPLTLK